MNHTAIGLTMLGSADISGIVKGGIRLEIECKTGLARQTKEQELFQHMIERLGGIYILARSVEQTCDQLQKILRLRGISIPC